MCIIIFRSDEMRDLTLSRPIKLAVSLIAAIVMGVFCSVVLSGEEVSTAGIISVSISFKVLPSMKFLNSPKRWRVLPSLIKSISSLLSW